jgi:hypothetical protein
VLYRAHAARGGIIVITGVGSFGPRVREWASAMDSVHVFDCNDNIVAHPLIESPWVT